jgi:lipopolysaccharide export system permease protein
MKEFFKLLGIIALGLALIFSLLDLVDKIDDFMPSKPSIMTLIWYAFLNLPKFLYYLLPMSLLICSLFIFSQASRNNELVAVKATGGRLRNLFYPFLLVGIVTSIFALIIGEIIVPDFSERLNELKNTLKNKESRVAFREGKLWLRGKDGALIRIELYIPEKKFAKNMSIFIIGDSSLRQRIEAETAEWIGKSPQGTWKLKNINIYDIEKGEIKHLEEMDYPNLESPDLFSEGIKKPQDMGIFELYRYIGRLEAVGIKDKKLFVDLYSKVSYPSTNFFLILLGLSLSVIRRIGGGLFAAGLGLSISFLYWLGYTFMLSLGYAGIIPAVVSSWSVPLILGAISVYFFKMVPE